MFHATSSTPGLSASPLPHSRRPRKLRLLVASTGPRDISWAANLVVRLSKDPGVEMRAIVDDVVPRISQTIRVLQNRSTVSTAVTAPGMGGAAAAASEGDVEFYRQQAFEMVEWADLLVLAPIEADGIAKMLAGVADTLLGEVLRGWDVEKKILLVPGMSTHVMRNPMTKRHLSKIERRWKWIRTMPPILWHYEKVDDPKRVVNWNGFNELLAIIKNQAELMRLGQEIDLGVHCVSLGSHNQQAPVRATLPPEIWTIILEFVGDWELAKALGIFTTTPMPPSWSLAPSNPNDAAKVYEHELEWTCLTCNSAAICKKISQSPPSFSDLPANVSGLLIRFALVDVLAYLDANRPTLLRAFPGRSLPTNASAYFPRTDVLDFWKSSQYFRDRLLSSYDEEAMDKASQKGYLHVLEWWWRSGLPLRYTEAALEGASALGHILVLAWWRDVAAQDERVVLRPGKSLLLAAQYGQTEVIKWWDASAIAVSHTDGIAETASQYGHVAVLELWRQLKGDDKVVFDREVLRWPTIRQNVGVLDWWKGFADGTLPGMNGKGVRVEYRTCDVEEWLEDSDGDQKAVRAWWRENGLDLGLRNKEWMMTRCL